jgi:amidase
MPAGFSADGLPVAIELLGRPFSDVRLVSMAYAFEQLGPRRRAPYATPRLVNGRAPGAATFSTTARGANGGATRASFAYDPTSSTLRYDVRVTGIEAPRLMAVTLRRRDARGVMRVAHVLMGPNVSAAKGSVVLTLPNREALLNGQLVLSAMTAGAPLAEAPVAMPRPRPGG